MACVWKWRWWIACCLLFPWAASAAKPAEVPAASPAAAAQSDRSPDPDAKPTDESPPSELQPAHEPGGDAHADSSGRERAARDRKAEEEYYDLYKTLADTIDQVERNYVKPVDRRELMEAAIKGIVSKLDPYSAYIGPDEFTRFHEAVESQFGGIGIQVNVEDGQLKIISPLVGTPAYRAGVEAGDKIVTIDGKPTEGISLDEATKWLKGDIGTSVTLSVQHAGSDKLETLIITRELIHVGTVLGNSRKPDGSWDFMLNPQSRIGYIRVTSFSRETSADLRKALEDLKRQKVRGLILDLRFNPGGLLSSAVEVSNLFITKGRIVSTKGRNTAERVWDAVKSDAFEDFPMVILVNHYSASAAEIVSACLQDNGRAVVAGDRTWGKGSVQNVVELESGKSALKLTTSSYTRPNGHKIHRFPDDKETDEWGVKPDKGLELKLSMVDMADLLADRRARDVVVGDHRAAKQSSAEAPSTQHTPPPAANAELKNDKTPASDAKAGAPKQKAKTAGPHGSRPSEKNTASGPDELKLVDRQLQKAVEYLTTELVRAQ